MSTIAISAVATPDWVERLDFVAHLITECAVEVRRAMVRERAVVRFFVVSRRLNGHIGELLAVLDEATRELQSGTSQFSDSTDDDGAAEQVLGSMDRMYKIVNGLHVLAVFAGFNRRTLTKGEVQKLGSAAERLLDYTTWMKDIISKPSRSHAELTFAEGLAELEAGDTVPFL